MEIQYKVHYEKKGKIVYITIQGRGDLNVWPFPLYRELLDALVKYRDDEDAWVAIVTGKGDKAFCSGGDLKYYTEHPEVGSRKARLDRFWSPEGGNFLAILDLELWKPVIAAINGYCLAAGFLYVFGTTDIRIAAEHAKFGLSEVRLGVGGGGGESRLALQIPHALAMYMILTGDMIDAQEAYRIGLVNKVVPLKDLMSTAEEIANKICDIPPRIVRVEKETTLRSRELPSRVGRRFTKAIQELSRVAPESWEGVQDFLAKKKRPYPKE